MTIRDVPPSRWCAFLERFSRTHRGWLATIHGIEGGAPVTRVPNAAIESITVDRHTPDSVVRFTLVNGVSLWAPRPSAIRVQEREDGAECALEIEKIDGAFLRLAFRATALPEQLDGLAPAEVADEMSAADAHHPRFQERPGA